MIEDYQNYKKGSVDSTCEREETGTNAKQAVYDMSETILCSKRTYYSHSTD